MEYFKKVFKQSFAIVVISSVFGIFSGSFLSSNNEILYTIPIILLILPSLNSLVGDISTVLVSRLTTHLYIGTIPPKFKASKRLKEDFLGLFITISLSLIVLIFFGYIFGLAMGITIMNPFLIMTIIIITILLLFFILFITLFLGSILIFRRGGDPSSFLIPILTSLADFLTPLILIILIIIFI